MTPLPITTWKIHNSFEECKTFESINALSRHSSTPRCKTLHWVKRLEAGNLISTQRDMAHPGHPRVLTMINSDINAWVNLILGCKDAE